MVPGMDIHRAQRIKDRIVRSDAEVLLGRDFTWASWMKYSDDSDKTVLATKKDHNVNKFSKSTEDFSQRSF